MEGDIGLLKPGAAVFVIGLKKANGVIISRPAIRREGWGQATDVIHLAEPSLEAPVLIRASGMNRQLNNRRRGPICG